MTRSGTGRRDLHRGAGLWALAAGLLTLELALAQSPPPPAAQPRHAIPAISRGNRLVGAMDDFAGLKLTNGQQAKVHEILEQTKARIDEVVKNDKLAPYQKGAMIQGLEHIERNDVFRILDPQQREVVRKRVLERREATRLEQEKTKESAPQ